MFGSGKGDWKEKDVERGDEGRDGRDETRMGDDGKTVKWDTAGVAGALRVFWTVFSRAGSATLEKRFYPRGYRHFKKITTGLISRVT